MKRNGGDFGENLVAQVRNNPVPTLLTGVGVAWLMMSSKRAGERYRSVPSRSAAGRFDQEGGGAAEDANSRLGERWSSAVDSVCETASDANHAAQDAVSAAANAARNAASTMGGAADAATGAARRAVSATRHSAEAMTQAARMSVQRVTQGYSHLAREQPLVLGALALVAGAAIGALLPSTDNEDEWLGDASDEVKARLNREAHDKADELEAAATAAAASVEGSMTRAAANGGEPSADNGEASEEHTTPADQGTA